MPVRSTDTPDNGASSAYRFGDSPSAAERLRLLAEVFAPSSHAFLAPLVLRRPRRVVDLGCGPGYTTRMLAEIFAESAVTGMDSSADYIALAKTIASERVDFIRGDVSGSLPLRDVDLVYCRYLLTHLPQPFAAIEAWSDSLAADGVIAVEENEWIHTARPEFETYLRIVDGMLRDAGHRLDIGAHLDQHSAWQSVAVLQSELVEIPVQDRAAAPLFVLNIQNWRSQPYIRQHYAEAEIEQLHQSLRHIAETAEGSSICFGRRRILLGRAR